EPALDVLADTHDHGVFGLAGRVRAQDVAEGDDLLVGVGDLDADGALAGDGREDAHVGGGDGVGDVLGQGGDAFDLGARGELDLVAGDRGAAAEAGDLSVDLELVQRVGQGLHDGVVGFRAFLRRGPGGQEFGIGQRVGDVA